MVALHSLAPPGGALAHLEKEKVKEKEKKD
jgi:hypothetical protein